MKAWVYGPSQDEDGSSSNDSPFQWVEETEDHTPSKPSINSGEQAFCQQATKSVCTDENDEGKCSLSYVSSDLCH